MERRTRNASADAVRVYQVLPETDPPTEYVEGKLRQKRVTKRGHRSLQDAFTSFLRDWAKSGGRFDSEKEWNIDFQIEERIRSLLPEVAIYPVNKIQKTPWDERFKEPPLLMVEILSSGQSIPQFLEKIAFYLEVGISLVWLVDPKEKTVTAFLPDRPSIFAEKKTDWKMRPSCPASRSLCEKCSKGLCCNEGRKPFSPPFDSGLLKSC